MLVAGYQLPVLGQSAASPRGCPLAAGQAGGCGAAWGPGLAPGTLPIPPSLQGSTCAGWDNSAWSPAMLRPSFPWMSFLCDPSKHGLMTP